MAITVNILYKGKNGSATKFAKEMTETGVVDKIRQETGNLRYEYYFSMEDAETVLLIDSWKNQEDIDSHHKSPMMQEIIRLRDKYDLQMEVKRYKDDDMPERDKGFIRTK